MKKTVLALAVSMASVHAFAQEVTIDDGKPYQIEFASLKDVVIDGSYSGDQRGVDVNHVANNGGIQNNADIISSADNAFRLANTVLSFDPEVPMVEGGATLINRATIHATGSDAKSLHIIYSSVIGELVNEGTISVIDGTPDDLIGARGLSVDESSIGATVRNEGTISATGTEASAMLFTNADLFANEVINRGTISAVGEESSGFEMINTDFGGKVVNDGKITADGINATALRLGQGSRISDLDNAGDILATGEDSVGVHIDGTNFVDGMINTGNISGDKAGVWVESYFSAYAPGVPNDAFDIKHEGGTISGKQNAILISEGIEADLIWGTATINGNLTNLAKIEVVGDAKFVGDRIDAVNGGLNIETGASLDLSDMSTRIVGDLELNSGAVIRVTYSPELLDNGSIIIVDGKAVLAENSEIAIRAEAADFAAGGRTFSLVQATELVDEGVLVAGGSESLTLTKNVAADNTITVTATRKTEEELEEVIETGDGNTNSQKAGSQFFEVAESLATSNPNDPVFQALVAATDAESLAKLAKQLAPDMTGSATQAATSGLTMVNNATGNRISAARSGMSSGFDMADTGLWIEALGSDAEQEMRDGIDGFSSDSKGFILGADVKLDEFTTLGAYYSNIATDTTTDAGNKNEAQTHLLGLYTSYQVGSFYVDGNLSAGRANNESERFIAGTAAEADFDSTILFASVMSGKSYALTENVFIEPRVAARYSNVRTESYTETGSSAALTMGDQRVETGEVGAGVRLSTLIDFHGGTLEPELSTMAYHDLIGDSAQGSAAYVLGGNTFTVTGATNDRATYEATLGAKYRRDNTTVGLSYSRMERSSFSADGFALKLRYDF